MDGNDNWPDLEFKNKQTGNVNLTPQAVDVCMKPDLKQTVNSDIEILSN